MIPYRKESLILKTVTVGVNTVAAQIQLELDFHHKLQSEELEENSVVEEVKIPVDPDPARPKHERRSTRRAEFCYDE
ncbi:hypothetical protein ZOSMA_57G00800 [Zostera marina]|uniref:Uncharacterized protein n=1 Tax=Zostera marina TaxID=29655 RepID=A0A0K9NVT7_ZOSMR|nr:hypothetical protein ZOSMA_57G00800 [Zostera marina]